MSAPSIATSPTWARLRRVHHPFRIHQTGDTTWSDSRVCRHYPRQCYVRALKYVQDHPDIAGMHLVHGVVSHAPLHVPFDHAWVELPGAVVFDGVVQIFFTHDSYYAVMAAAPLDSYLAADAERLAAVHHHPGPWTASWVPTRAQHPHGVAESTSPNHPKVQVDSTSAPPSEVARPGTVWM